MLIAVSVDIIRRLSVGGGRAGQAQGQRLPTRRRGI